MTVTEYQTALKARSLFVTGHDSLQIAQRLKISEPKVIRLMDQLRRRANEAAPREDQQAAGDPPHALR